MEVELVRRVRDTDAFLRMTAIELRRIAEQAPDIADELRHVAEKLEAETADLARCVATSAARSADCSGRSA